MLWRRLVLARRRAADGLTRTRRAWLVRAHAGAGQPGFGRCRVTSRRARSHDQARRHGYGIPDRSRVLGAWRAIATGTGLARVRGGLRQGWARRARPTAWMLCAGRVRRMGRVVPCARARLVAARADALAMATRGAATGGAG